VRQVADFLTVGVRRKNSKKHVFHQPSVNQRPVLSSIGDLQLSPHLLQTVAWPCRVQLACKVECIKDIMGRKGNTQSRECYCQKA